MKRLKSTAHRGFKIVYLGCLLFVVASGVCGAAAEARLEVLSIESRLLKNNPLHDPTLRKIPVFLPAQATPGARLPVVYYLPGYGNNIQKSFIQNSNAWLKLTQKIADEIEPVIIAMVDGGTRWGGSQYLNSAAQGNYEDYVCNEIVSAVEALHAAPTHGVRRLLAGHSSGGFGALRLGSSHQTLFDAVIALSPDSDFPVSHLPLVLVPAVTNVPLTEILKIAAGQSPMPTNGSLKYLFGLSAAYAPRPLPQGGEFSWLFDSAGNFRPEIWQLWLDNDPLTIVQKNPEAFDARQSIYLEGASLDEFRANVGAQKIYDVLRTRPGRCAFYEPPGRHSDNIRERFMRGMQWVFRRPLVDVPVPTRSR